MALADELRQRARATWAAGDWDGFSRVVAPVGAVVLDRVGIEPGQDLLDVGTGSGGTIAIPAAQRGAFLAAFSELVTRFNAADDDRATIRSDYLVITVER